jgi:hypothetical protein
MEAGLNARHDSIRFSFFLRAFLMIRLPKGLIFEGFSVAASAIMIGWLTSVTSPTTGVLNLFATGAGAGFCSTFISSRSRRKDLSTSCSEKHDSSRGGLPAEGAVLSPMLPPTRDISSRENSSPPAQDQAVDTVIEWLASRKIHAASPVASDLGTDSVFNRQALFMGAGLDDSVQPPLLLPLLKSIKWSVANKKSIRYVIGDPTQRRIAAVTNLCTGLLNQSLLSSYRYDRKNKVISAEIQDRKDIRFFFGGGWFERYICQSLVRLLRQKRVAFEYATNLMVRFPNGDRFELDIFFLIDGLPLLIECKTGGAFQAHLQKFRDHLERLSVPAERGLFIILDLDPARAVELSGFWGYRVVNQNQFPAAVEAIVGSFSG